MQRDTFSRARKILGDTHPTPGAHPPNVPILADRLQPTSRTRSVQLRFQIFLEQLQCNVKHFHVREKKLGSYLVAGNPFAASWRLSLGCVCEDSSKGLLRRRRRVDRHRFDGERSDERRERLLARRQRRRVHATAGRADVSGAARLPRACQPRCQRRPHPLAHRAASCPSDAAPVRPASRGVLSRPASRVGGAPGARGARATRAHARRV